MSDNSAQRIAIFGAAFNPPTLGHQDVIQFILAQQPQFDQVLLVPSYQHAFQKQMVTYSHRVQMVAAFVADINHSRVKMLAIEDEIALGGSSQQPALGDTSSKDNAAPHSSRLQSKPVYTYDVLAYLQQHRYPKAELTFVIGPDNQQNWHKFYKSEEILHRWSLLVAPERRDIRSTGLRNSLAAQQSAAHLTTPGVLNYIQHHRLYTDID